MIDVHGEQAGSVREQHGAGLEVAADARDAVLVGICGIRQTPATRRWLDAHGGDCPRRRLFWTNPRFWTDPDTGMDRPSTQFSTKWLPESDRYFVEFVTPERHHPEEQPMKNDPHTPTKDERGAVNVYIPGIVVVILLVLLVLVIF